MTFTNQTNRISATGTGSAGQIVSFSFPVNETSDLTIMKRVTATGVESTLVETTNYTVSITGDTGGTVTTVTAIETTEQIHIIRDTPQTQPLDLENGGDFNAENMEDALDKNCKLTIENTDALTRTLRFPKTDPPTAVVDIDNAIDRKGKYLYFDSSTGAPTAATQADASAISVSAFAETYLDDATAIATMATLQGVNVYNVRNVAYGAVGDGSTNDELAIEAAITAATVNGGTVYFPNTGNAYKFNTAITVPADVSLMFEPGATLMGDGSSTLTFTEQTLIPTEHQVFESTMAVAGLNFTRPQWFGALADDSNDDSTAIQAAVDALSSGATGEGGVVYFSPGTYLCTTGISSSNRKVEFLGVGMDSTIIKKNANIDLITLTGSSSQSKILNLRLDGNSKTAGALVNITGANFWTIENVRMTGNAGTAATDSNAALYAGVASSGGNVYRLFMDNNTRQCFITASQQVRMDTVLASGGSVAEDFEFENCYDLRLTGMSLSVDDTADPAGGITLDGCGAVLINDLYLEHQYTFPAVTVGASGGPCRGVEISNVWMKKTGSDTSTSSAILVNNASVGVTLRNIWLRGGGTGDHDDQGWIELSTCSDVVIHNFTATGLTADITGTNAIFDSGAGVSYLLVDGLYDESGANNMTVDINADYGTFRNSNVDITIDSSGSFCKFENCTGTILGTGAHYSHANDTGRILEESVTLTAAQVKTLSTPFELLSAGGAGFMLEFISATIYLDYGGTGNWAGGSDLVIEHQTSGLDVSSTITMAGFLDQTNDEIRKVSAKDITDSDLVASVQKGFYLHNTGANYTDNGGTPTSTLRVKILYVRHATGL